MTEGENHVTDLVYTLNVPHTMLAAKKRNEVKLLVSERLEWAFYQNVNRMHLDGGKNPILNSVYLTGIQMQCPKEKK